MIRKVWGMRVAAIGDNCIDFYLKLNRFYPTGNAVDFAVNIRKLGLPTSLITVVGDDEYGRVMMETLKQQKLDLTHTKVVSGSTALTVMDMHGNERIHGEYKEGVMETACFSEEDIEFTGAHDYVHSTFLGRADQHLEKIKESGAKISFDYSVDLDCEMVNRTIGYVDYPFFSYKKRDSYIEQYLKDKVCKGAKIAVATFGEEGSLAYDGSRFYEYGIIKSNVVNTIGAGDSFIAGFIFGMARGMEIIKCMEQGARVAAGVVSVFGPWKGDGYEGI